MEKLKPCPFCGGKAELSCRRSCYDNWMPIGFIPQCKNTKCLGRTHRQYKTKAEAIEAWNRRAGDSDETD